MTRARDTRTCIPGRTLNGTICATVYYEDGRIDVTVHGVTFRSLTREEYDFFWVTF